MPIQRKETSIAQRVQALTLHAKGAATAEIEAVTGIKKDTFKALLRKAKLRGYSPGGPVKDEHVENAPRSGRPRVRAAKKAISSAEDSS